MRGRKTAAPAAAEVEVEEVEEGLLEEAMREPSINKYFAADPLWTGQLVASGMAWALVVRRCWGGDTNRSGMALQSEDDSMRETILLLTHIRRVSVGVYRAAGNHDETLPFSTANRRPKAGVVCGEK